MADCSSKHLSLPAPFFSRLCLSKFHLKTWPGKKRRAKRGKCVSLIAQRVKIMPPERGRGGEGEVGGWKRGGGKGGMEKDEEKRRKNGSFCSLFRVIPRGQINPCCLSPFRFGGEGGGGGGGKGITSTEGEWHKVENLPVVYRLVYNTGLSERPRSPLLRRFCEQNLKLLISSPALFLALQLRKSTTFSATSADLLLLFYLLSIPVSIPFEQKYVYIYIYRLCSSQNETFCAQSSQPRGTIGNDWKKQRDTSWIVGGKEGWRGSRRASPSSFNFYPLLLFSSFLDEAENKPMKERERDVI